MERIHATCVAFEGEAVLLRGPSGSGKSDLALRLMDQGWCLVADDYSELFCQDETLYACSPDTLKGLLEVRGLGLIQVEHLDQAPVVAIFDLVTADTLVRLPDLTTERLQGLDVPLYRLQALHASAPAKIRLALNAQKQSLFYTLEA